MNNEPNRKRWRLLTSAVATPAENMAIDEAVVEAVASGVALPTMRFYGWNPPGLSLGYFQRSQGIDRLAAAADGVSIVRRMTGGRAVLHDRELTYSIICPESYESLPRQVNEAYRFLSEGLVRGYRKLGLEARLMRFDDPAKIEIASERTDACFDTPSWYELVIEGRKAAGSAQVRKKGVLLQHGSILLELHGEKLGKLLTGVDHHPASFGKMLDEKSVAIFPLFRAKGQIEPSLADVERAMREGMQEALRIEWVEEGLSEGEMARVQELVGKKYASDAWTFRR